jgi:hypothetical protein
MEVELEIRIREGKIERLKNEILKKYNSAIPPADALTDIDRILEYLERGDPLSSNNALQEFVEGLVLNGIKSGHILPGQFHEAIERLKIFKNGNGAIFNLDRDRGHWEKITELADIYQEEVRILTEIKKASGAPEREAPPDGILELISKGWLKIKAADNGKFDILEEIQKEFFDKCAFEGYFLNKKLTIGTIDRWINHGYSTNGKANSLYQAINKAKTKYSERLEAERKHLETQSLAADKLIEAADKTEQATKNRIKLLKKTGYLDG